MLTERKQKIRILDEKTINQIAAGEVIENPASVVKELIENAIDAGATCVDVEIKAGGRQWIRISDDGCGMERDDVFLCLERHATSKIHSSEDLHSLFTLGFRGEAIPSIASISKLAIDTAPDNGKEGTSIRVEGGKILDWRACARTHGTTFEVKSLFYNVPVRKKFQKSVAADTAEIHRVFLKMALCYPQLHLKLVNDEKVHLDLRKGTLESRISSLFEKEIVEELISIEETHEKYWLRGMVGRSSCHRPNRLGNYLFINGRPLDSHFISDCVKEAYGTRLPVGRYPFFILHLKIPGEEIDVNVHPQKKKARIIQESNLRQWLFNCIEKGLQKRGRDFIPAPVSQTLFEANERLFSIEKPMTVVEEQIAYTVPNLEPKLFSKTGARFLAWIGPYALLEVEGKVNVVNLKAAQRRLFYEHAFNRRERLGIQSLLFPISIQLSSEESILLEEHLKVLEVLGISGRQLSGHMLVIDAIPLEMNYEMIPNFIKGLIHELMASKEIKREDLVKRMCRELRKNKWSEEEVLTLYKDLQGCQIPYECPNGEPTLIEWTVEKMEKEFSK